MFCPLGHVRPAVVPKRKDEETGRMRMTCDECDTFYVAGNRNPEIRCYSKTWERKELLSLLQLQAFRQDLLAADIKNPEYQMNGILPPIRWGYQSEFECNGCIIKDRIGCPGIDESTGIEEAQALEVIQR